ncbi:NAD-dependent epimerase/dehydratase [Pseudomonas syringae pv. theae ICMP 3923]|uniref:Uncharacterized protein n=1 Tax=Pseudomonas syringae pv. theae TaxID=103985 RepID=A0A0Q0GD14_PSESX|nr:NAD(P)-dependent oxidoreductase [Pseudomonas syringae]EPM65743.1 NAD-dependent epimerase/dehydratase [Pseudomonas syringae pv. theae ICMP 3923]KPZ34374.1 hypothetical protein AN901_204886 [Pseudomonas syringae pv. theae]MBL3874886.1 NAD(P)-dependent oxidoreductase [Pseudomonas syringae pv. theae]RMT73316.1 putative protein-dependent epimerase/dehydratase [Pseudomonas syringae pv. theae]GKQ33422.1 hypothetical protein PSTH68_27905 [Pseudomonas syringae pv. theae]
MAQGIELALHHDVRGKNEFFITNDETVMRTPSSELLDKHYPNIERRNEIKGNEVLLSNEKAKRVLGFKPAYSWTDEVSQTK